MHQTGNNSGVIHSGLYYKPGSLKAKNCVEGRELMYKFCEEYNIKHEKCGKIVVAATNEELPNLNELENRGIANGLSGIKRLRKEELREYEPYINGIAGLYIPQTGIVDYIQVTETYSKLINKKGGEIKLKTRFKKLIKSNNELILLTDNGELKTKLLINCGGLYSDRVAAKCGLNPEVKIIPFRGEYYKLKREKEYFVKNLIYPVPDPKFPFLGVHFTRMVRGGIEAGPNAVLAFKRKGYTKFDISFKDLSEMFFYSGFWKMASKYYKVGFEEMHRSFSKKIFVNALQKLIPDITEEDVEKGGAGVRAQALDKYGKLLDDFYIIETDKMVHVLNAPSPAATASISIGNTIAKKVLNKS
jgi:L-2-hydroxyglutarate oxidase